MPTIDATPADRQAHSALLGEVEQITQLHRKNLVWLAGYLAAHGELVITPELLAKLDAIRISTVGRILSRIRQDEPRLSRKGPKSVNRVARQIPMTRIPWHETQPGRPEIDLVHHSGLSVQGEYVPIPCRR